MLDVLFEQELVQNTGLGAEAIFETVAAYYKHENQTRGLSFPFVFLVLPLVFHKRTVSAIKSRAGAGALRKALRADREISIGLQQRMESMSETTLAACSLALDSGLMLYDSETAQLIPTRASLSQIRHDSDAVSDIRAAAKRVGVSFSELSLAEISTLLEVVF